MSLLEEYKIGDKVLVLDLEHRIFKQEVEIIEIDNHPFEYAQLKVRLINSVALPIPEIWISSRKVLKRTI